MAHRDQLCDSTFFHDALEKEWLEGQARKIFLPDDDPEAVQHYLYFLYTHQMPRDLGFVELVSVYVLGEKMVDADLKNVVLEEVLDLTTWSRYESSEFFAAVEIMYEGTPPSILGRKSLVDIFHAEGTPDWLEEEDLHAEFMKEVLAKLLDFEPRPSHMKLAIRDYQEKTD